MQCRWIPPGARRQLPRREPTCALIHVRCPGGLHRCPCQFVRRVAYSGKHAAALIRQLCEPRDWDQRPCGASALRPASRLGARLRISRGRTSSEARPSERYVDRGTLSNDRRVWCMLSDLAPGLGAEHVGQATARSASLVSPRTVSESIWRRPFCCLRPCHVPFLRIEPSSGRPSGKQDPIAQRSRRVLRR